MGDTETRRKSEKTKPHRGGAETRRGNRTCQNRRNCQRIQIEQLKVGSQFRRFLAILPLTAIEPMSDAPILMCTISPFENHAPHHCSSRRCGAAQTCASTEAK